MKSSSAFKVGILTIVALIILLFTILWVNGRAFSSAKRINVDFKDVNGMRPGSGVQMMGLRVGQVEKITPIIKNEDSTVRITFVITEPNIAIPKASMISIQQSGLIGEQFLEITPPKTRTIYIPATSGVLVYKDDPVEIKLDDKYYDVGVVKSVQLMDVKLIPLSKQVDIKTKNAYKVDYIVNMPGLILPHFMSGQLVGTKGNVKVRISPLDNVVLNYPKPQISPYTIIEPMRIADFLDLQYQAAQGLTETNKKLNDILSDDVIAELKQSIGNINALTAQAKTTVQKAEKLIEASHDDLDALMVQANRVSNSFVTVTDNINNIIGDEEFKPVFYDTTESLNHLAKNLNKVLDNMDSKVLAKDLTAIMSNVSEISTSINQMTSDEKLKKELHSTVVNINKAMLDISNALEIVNKMTPNQKTELSQIMKDVSISARNLRKFSDKLNKRFLLFRLMF